MLLKSRASPDMLPFSLCNQKGLAIRHMNRPLFPKILSIPSYDIGKFVGLRTYQYTVIWMSCVSAPFGQLWRMWSMVVHFLGYSEKASDWTTGTCLLAGKQNKLRKVNLIGHILRRNCVLKHAIEGKIEGRIEWREDEEEDVSSCRMTLRKRENTVKKKEARDARRITWAEMKYMRRTAGYTRTDYKTNAQIAKELKITQILDKLLEYKRNWIQHVNRMPRNRLPRVMKRYSPNGRMNHGRPLKRLLDTWDRNGSTCGLTPWHIYNDDDSESNKLHT